MNTKVTDENVYEVSQAFLNTVVGSLTEERAAAEAMRGALDNLLRDADELIAFSLSEQRPIVDRKDHRAVVQVVQGLREARKNLRYSFEALHEWLPDFITHVRSFRLEKHLAMKLNGQRPSVSSPAPDDRGHSLGCTPPH